MSLVRTFFWAWVALWTFQAFTLGMTDDEAYYWVLSQQPALGYAYHPPMIAWLMGATDWITGAFNFLPHSGRIRLGAVAMSSFFFGAGLLWVRETLRQEQGRAPRLADLFFLILPGLAGAAWMSVPDLPLFVGWSLAFWGCSRHESKLAPHLLFWGAAIGLLSKFSAVLFIASAAACLVFFPIQDRRRWTLLGALVLGTIAALIPTLIWNAQNDWAALRYQFIDRHQSGGSADLRRYWRFWASQLLLAGPALLVASVGMNLTALRTISARAGSTRVLWLWFFPAAAVYLVQPLFSDFKAHWALVAWWPVALWSATQAARPRWFAPLHATWAVLILSVWTSFSQFPLQARLTEWWTGSPGNPHWDITNDLYGWRELPEFLRSSLGEHAFDLPVLGARYQTASQAAFALQGRTSVTLVGRGPNELQEWPQLAGTLEPVAGSNWPRLKRAVLFVADSRYSTEPAFPGSRCSDVGTLDARRGPYPAKRIRIWRCEPGSPAISATF